MQIEIRDRRPPVYRKQETPQGNRGQDCGIGFELRLKNYFPTNFELVKE
ncbi:MAG: hypothetical protein ACO2PP_11645 [Thermocrinis sp.]